jgi:prepilin-type N-terminal cleavage/methylation domain-containing protein
MKSSRAVLRHRRHSAQGFSLLEMVIVVAIIMVACAITTMSMKPVARQQRVTAAYNTVLSTLRRAHDQAAADMRVYVVSFTAPGTMTVNQNTPGGTQLLSVTLPSDITFHLEAGIPTSQTVAPTTPDGFGTASFAIDFDQGISGGGATAIYFQPDGTAVDNNGNINNGVVYFGRPGELYSTRAITLWGSTGRIRGWRLYPGAQASWSQQ